jgi:hypothetical protein
MRGSAEKRARWQGTAERVKGAAVPQSVIGAKVQISPKNEPPWGSRCRVRPSHKKLMILSVTKGGRLAAFCNEDTVPGIPDY